MKFCEKTTEIQNENNLFNLEASAEAISSVINRLDNRSSTNTYIAFIALGYAILYLIANISEIWEGVQRDNDQIHYLYTYNTY